MIDPIENSWYSFLMAKKKVQRISKLLLGELIVLILLLLLVPYSKTRVYQSNSNEKTGDTPGVSISHPRSSHLGGEVKGNLGLHLPGEYDTESRQTSGRQIRIPILMYHYIGNNPDPADVARDNLSVAPDKFDEQMGYLSKSGYSPIILDTMVAGLGKQITLPEKPIVLTFDDGYIDFYFNAFPILQKYSFKSVVFLPTGLVGKKSYLTWDMISKMHSSGLVSFQAHSVNHAHLTSISHESLISEVGESKKTLQEKLSVPVNFIAYPYGASNGDVISAVKGSGYIGALGTWTSSIQSEGTIYNMPRIKIAGNWNLGSFASAF